MIKFIDLFAGTGGIRLGFEQACKKLGINTECAFASEIDKNACASYELNFGHNPFSDVREVKNCLVLISCWQVSLVKHFRMLESERDLEIRVGLWR